MDLYTVNLGGRYHDDVRVPVLSVPWCKDVHPTGMNAVLQDSEDQICFQGIHQSRSDTVQEFSGGIRLGTH